MSTRISLEMWRAFVAVAEEGSSIKAAKTLNKSQSAVIHSLKKMEHSLGNALFTVEGRQSVLTALGHSMLPKAHSLLNQARQMERMASHPQGQILSEIPIAVDVLFPQLYLEEVLERFQYLYPDVSIRVYETALSGSTELLEQGEVLLAITSRLPKGTVQSSLIDIDLICVCSVESDLMQHSSHTLETLADHQHIVIRDSGKQGVDSGWLGTSRRFTVTSAHCAAGFVRRNMGFAWLPANLVANDLATGELQRVPLKQGGSRQVKLHLGMHSDCAHIQELQTLFDLFSALKSLGA